jgi:LPS-assembly protein
VNVAADRAVLDHGADLAQLSGGVEIVQGDQRVEAERADYHRGSGEVTAVGGVYVEYPGARLLAQSGRYNLNTKEGALEGVSYRMADTANLRGTAAQAALLPGDLTHYRDITYTTCPPGRSDWSIRASDLLLDHPEGLGTARHARILLGPVPVLYSPWLQFPIDDRRRSGLLIPTIGTSNETGLDITVPYYWNIAPNLDATFFPRLMSSRGIMLGAEVRHLASFQELSVEGEVIPEDAEDPQAGTRGALHIEQIGHLGPRWYSSVDYTSVSDDNYLTDFGNRLDVTSTRNLPQRGDLIYFGDGYTVLTRVQDFQTVDPTVQGQFAPYAQMPHVELIDQPKRWGETLEYDLDGSYDYFDHSAKVHGSRGVALPSLRLPLRRSYGYLTPRARAYAIGYELTETDPDQSPRQSYLIPSLDIDSKLIFERETSWFGTGLLQTLEPRLYYVLTPYADQSQAPLFDTTELDFSFASLFRPNRFTGYDRIGDENRLTFGLTSRSMATESGRELFRASLGQIYYFADRRVQLAGDTPSEDGTSSVAGELAASLGQDWDARASVQWNPHSAENELEKRVLTLRYAPQDDRILNLAYRYNLGQTAAEHYEDTDLSFRFPLGPQVKLVGRWLYSLANDETVDAFAGIELGRCCWRLRILGRHLKTSANASGSTSIMLQLELAGLGAFGNSIDKLLEQGIYGYGTDR